jgi:hypothetical protein
LRRITSRVDGTGPKVVADLENRITAARAGLHASNKETEA